MKRVVLVLLIMLYLFKYDISYCDVEPTATPDKEGFSLSKDNYSIFSNSINTLTGEVSFSLNLGTVMGRQGQSYAISASYSSSGAYHAYTTWNMESPTGILGMSWSFELPKIIVDNKKTGTRTDDEFYLVSGGRTTELIRYKTEGTTYYFKASDNKVGEYIYNSTTEKWTVNPGDGNEYVYGDENSGRNTVEWVIHWDNWIGNSSETTNQSRQGLVWDISEVTNKWGEQIFFTYTTVERPLKTGEGLKQTEASYLTKISTSLGYYAELDYELKETEEYYEESTEVAEPYTGMNSVGEAGDAYQERLEKEYLQGLRIYDNNNQLQKAVEFTYEVRTQEGYKKRLLTQIREKTKYGSYTGPGLQFTYATTGPRSGSLLEVTTNSGAKVIFDYSNGITIPNSSRNLSVSAPEGYAEAKVWMGHDYAVVAWRQLKDSGTGHTAGDRNVKLEVYKWNGRWESGGLDISIDDVEVEAYTYADLYITLEKDFFAVAHKSSATEVDLWIAGCNRVTKEWTLSTYEHEFPKVSPPFYSSFSDEIALFSGDRFVALASARKGDVYLYRYKDFVSRELSLDYTYVEGESVDSKNRRFSYGSSNNYFIKQNDLTNPDDISLYYLDADQEWQVSTMSSDLCFNSVDNYSYWYAGPSNVYVMADDVEEYAYTWTTDYSFDTRTAIAQWNEDEPSSNPVFVMNGDEIVTTEKGLSSGGKWIMAYYNGSTWSISDKKITDQNGWGVTASFGDKIGIWNASYQTEAGILHYSINTESWSEGSYALEGTSGVNAFGVGYHSLFIENKFYEINNDGTVSYLMDLPISACDAAHFKSSGDYYYFNIGSVEYVFHYKNGEIEGPLSLSNEVLSTLSGSFYNSTVPIYQNKFATFNAYTQQEATKVYLHNYLNGSVSGNQVVYPVESVTINDGEGGQVTGYTFDSDYAEMDANGYYAYYNKVDIIPGGDTEEKPYGYTSVYQFNGMSSSESSKSFTTDNSGNATSTYKYLFGKVYARELYENTGGSYTGVGEELISYRTYFDSYTNNAGNQSHTYTLSVPVYTYKESEGVSKETSYTYNYASTFLPLLSTEQSYSYDRSGNEDELEIEKRYWYEVYDTDLSEHFCGPAIQQKRIVNGEVVSVTANKWEQAGSNGEWVNTSKYVWKGTGGDDFTAWEAGNAASEDWRKLSEVLSIDEKGNVLRTRSEEGIITENTYDNNWLVTEATSYPEASSEDKVTAEYYYDSDNRLKQIASNVGKNHLTYLYDEKGSPLATFKRGGVLTEGTSQMYNSYMWDPENFETTFLPSVVHQTLSTDFNNKYEDFEGYSNIGSEMPIGEVSSSLDQWNVLNNSGSSSWSIVDNSLYVSMSASGSTGQDYIYLDLEEGMSEEVGIEFSVFCSAPSSNRSLGVVVGDASWAPGSTTGEILELAFTNEELQSNGTSWETIAATKVSEYFHRVQLILHETRQTYDVYIDGKLFSRGQSYKNTVTEVAKIGFTNYISDASSSWYIDNLLIYTHPIQSSTFVDATGKKRQQQTLLPEDSVLVTQVIYDDLWRDYIKTRGGEVADNGLNYLSDFAVLESDNTLSGQIADLYDSDCDKPYFRTIYDQSPLNRVISKGQPGCDLNYEQGHTPQITYGNNSRSEIPENDFASGQFYVQAVYGDNDRETYTFKDKQGQTISEWIGPLTTSQLVESTENVLMTADDTVQVVITEEVQTIDIGVHFSSKTTIVKIGTTAGGDDVLLAEDESEVTVDLDPGTYYVSYEGNGTISFSYSTYESELVEAYARTDYEYDDRGNLISVYTPDYFTPPVDRLDSEAGYVSTYEYDFFGNVVHSENPDAGESYYEYDDLGRELYEQDAAALSNNYKIYTTYDDWGRVIEKGIEKQIESGTSVELPEGSYTEGQYFAEDITVSGDITVESEGVLLLRASNSIEMAPGFTAEAGSAFTAELGDVGAQVWKQRLHYGTYTEEEINDRGLLLEIEINDDEEETAEVTERYTYDVNGNITEKEITSLDGESNTIAYTYDAGGNIRSKTYPGEATLSYEYDVSGRLIALKEGEQTLATYRYGAGGQLTEEHLNEGNITRSYSYNDAGWLSVIEDDFFKQEINYFDYGYEGANFYDGKISSEFNTFKWNEASYMAQYDYDAQGRLTVADYSSGITIPYSTTSNSATTSGVISDVVDYSDLRISGSNGYDMNGNILNKTKGNTIYAYEYEKSSNRVTSLTYGASDAVDQLTESYGYDVAGNINETSSLNFEYDTYRNLTSQVSFGSSDELLSYAYGLGNNRRLKRLTDGEGNVVSETRYYSDGGLKPYKEVYTDATGAESEKYYIYGPSGLLAIRQSGNTYYALKDHQGSPRVIVDQDNNVVNHYSYGAFGSLIGGDYSSISDDISYQYTGQEYEEETGLYNYVARLYDTKLGRFYGVDPQGQFASGYTGMGNNPVAAVDKDGEWVNFVVGAVIGGISTYASARKAGVRGLRLAAFTTAGAVIGAVSAGSTSAITSSLQASSSSILSTAAVSNTVGGAAGGMISNAYSNAMYGGNFFEGAWQGFWRGAVGGAISSLGGGYTNATGNVRIGIFGPIGSHIYHSTLYSMATNVLQGKSPFHDMGLDYFGINESMAIPIAADIYNSVNRPKPNLDTKSIWEKHKNKISYDLTNELNFESGGGVSEMTAMRVIEDNTTRKIDINKGLEVSESYRFLVVNHTRNVATNQILKIYCSKVDFFVNNISLPKIIEINELSQAFYKWKLY